MSFINETEQQARTLVRIRLKGGIELTPDQAEEALNNALHVVGYIGTTACGTGDAWRAAEKWLTKYYPNYL